MKVPSEVIGLMIALINDEQLMLQGLGLMYIIIVITSKARGYGSRFHTSLSIYPGVLCVSVVE